MERFWKYMEDEPTGLHAVAYLFLWLIIFEIYLCSTFLWDFRLMALIFVGLEKSLMKFLLMAAEEEIVFRAIPFILVRMIFGGEENKFRISVLFCWIVISFVFFGPLHMFIGKNKESITFFSSIGIQGVMGFLSAGIYLKCGGMRKKIVKPLVASTFFHLTHNVFVNCARYVKIS